MYTHKLLAAALRVAKRSSVGRFGIALGFLSTTAAASASNSTVNTFNEGYFSNADLYVAANQSYFAGQFDFGNGTIVGFHNFFAFNALTGLDGPITSATLNILEPVAGYTSNQPSETFTLTAFPGDISTLTTDGVHPGEFALLANGPVVGQATVTSADDGRTVSISLNASGVNYLNSTIGSQFAFGGFLSSVPLLSTDSRFIFASSGNLPLISTQLDITTTAVDEPGTLSLGGVGLVSILGLMLLAPPGNKNRLTGSATVALISPSALAVPDRHALRVLSQ